MSAEPQPPTIASSSGVWRARSVAEELEELFVRATGLPSMPAPPSPPSPRVQALAQAPRERRGGGPAVAGAVVAAGLVGLAFGVLLVSARAVSPDPPAPRAMLAAAAMASPVAVVTPAPDASVSKPKTATQAPPKAGRIKVGAARPSVCVQARCSHADLLAADRKLRKAFSRAVDAGVPRSVLVTYRNRWASLRHDAIYRPNRVASGYGAMAGDLNRLAARRRAHSS